MVIIKQESVIKNFVERQGDSLVGGIVLRKFENLKQIGFHERSGMPISEEYPIINQGKSPVIRYCGILFR